jgi:hypothetical protein
MSGLDISKTKAQIIRQSMNKTNPISKVTKSLSFALISCIVSPTKSISGNGHGKEDDKTTTRVEILAFSADMT